MTRTQEFAARIEAERAAVIAAQSAPTVPCQISTTVEGPSTVSLVCANCGPVATCLPGYVQFMTDRHLAEGN